ncbi:flavin reductase family protein [Subtercola lobariae]|uniref:Flavin reductase n=1 Tax=Subtercola lobariae TaxID=1588641 RepID=A0A917B2F6_9MICO|nr:flavin reductase family protein [Subtercola lobariae]GGF15648.1 flavin reductase [Subtercola lobariae]
MTIDPFLFRETLGHYPTGVAVITAIVDGQPAGMVVGTFSSVSLDPPLVAFLPTRKSQSFAKIRTSDAFCINVLASDQEPLCRQLATSSEHKFDDVSWRPGPLGSPVLDDAVSWIECTYEDIREAGDHFIVLGLVHDLAVARSTLPLLFFQGGYGRFSPGSFVAAPDPELIQSARIAESMRPQLEAMSAEFQVNCSVLARIRWDAVQVLAANQSPLHEAFPLGYKQPIVPPLGTVFLVDAPESDIDVWLSRAADDSAEQRAANVQLLENVRTRGYSVLAAEPEVIRRHEAALSEFELSDRLPRHEREVRRATSELGAFLGSELVPGQTYDLASIVVPVPATPDQPTLTLRMTGMHPGASTDEVHTWISRLQQIAADVTVPAA